MKKCLLTCFLISGLSSLFLYGQDVSYRYDKAGNRKERVIELKSAEIAKNQLQEPAPVIEDLLSEQEILIYPNPTEGELSVSISNVQDIEGEVLITTINGEVLIRKKVVSTLMHFDLSNNAAGFYIMKIILNGEATTWKIIKN